MGACGFIGCAILLFLPETLNKPLPNNIEEIEQSGNKPNIFQILWKRLTPNDKPQQADIVLKKVSTMADEKQHMITYETL